MTTHERPTTLIDEVTEQLLSLLDATGTIDASEWAKKIVATCNEHKIVADDNLLTYLHRVLAGPTYNCRMRDYDHLPHGWTGNGRSYYCEGYGFPGGLPR